MRTVMLFGIAAVLLNGADLSKAIESPDAKAILAKDALPAAKAFQMPEGCISNDSAVIARGSYIFHNLNGSKAKENPPEGLSRKNADGSEKQYGNCVACHNIEKAKGYGNIGPDLTEYHNLYVKSGVRNAQFVYQKIADPRIDNPVSHMTVNLTNGLMNEREVCDLASYILAEKK